MISLIMTMDIHGRKAKKEGIIKSGRFKPTESEKTQQELNLSPGTQKASN